MRTLSLLLGIYLFTACSTAQITSIQFEENEVCLFNPEYSYTDTLRTRFDDQYLIEDRPDEWAQQFVLDLATQQKWRYILNLQDKQKYAIKMERSPDSVIVKTGQQKEILGILCDHYTLKTESADYEFYLHPDWTIPYGPIYPTPGFVMEFTRKTETFERTRRAISLDHHSGGLTLPNGYTAVEADSYYEKLKQGQETRSLVEVGETAPDFSVLDLNQNLFDSQKLRGEVIVLNFWAIGCRPCVMEIPLLNEIKEEYADQDVHFLAVGMESPFMVKIFDTRRNFDFNLIPASIWMHQRYGVRSMPTTVIIDQQGKVHAIYSMVHEGIKEAFTATLDALLGG